MQTKIIKLDPANIDIDIIREAAQIIDAGGLVAFPTETVYGIACRVRTDSLSRLNQIKGRVPEKPYTLHIGRKKDVEKYVPTIGLRTKKLIRHAWPGPLTIVFELNKEQLDTQRKKFDEEIFENLYKDNSIGIRLPADPVAEILLQTTKNPVVAPSVNFADQPPAADAGQIIKQFAGKLDMLLDAGPSKYKMSSTVVKTGQNQLSILRQGVCTPQQIRQMSTVQILFVCTGNTCRSPMAEAIVRKYLAEKLACTIDQLEKKGYVILSAGTIGIVGMLATGQAIAACETKGVDIKAHRSSAVSRALIEQSDLIYVMGQFHLKQILAICPDAAEKCQLLDESGDIPDPIGQSMEVYENVAKMIEKAAKKRIDELIL